MGKFTRKERALVKTIVAELAIKRIPQSEIINEIYRQTNKTITKTALFHIKQSIKKESYHWYKTMREGEYEYLHEFKERINEIIDLQKKTYQIFDNNGTSFYDGLGLPGNSFYKSLRFKNFNTIASYQKFTYDLKKISKYKAEIDYLNSFSKLFSPNKYSARFLELKANY